MSEFFLCSRFCTTQISQISQIDFIFIQIFYSKFVKSPYIFLRVSFLHFFNKCLPLPFKYFSFIIPNIVHELDVTAVDSCLAIRAISNYLKYHSPNSKLNATSTYFVARNRDAVEAIRIHLPVTINIQLIQKFLKRILCSRAIDSLCLTSFWKEDKNGSGAYVPLEWHRIREIIMQLCWRASVFAWSLLRFEQIFDESPELSERVSRKMVTRGVRSIDPRRMSSRPSSLKGVLTILWTNV